jgi:hypothetical protein
MLALKKFSQIKNIALRLNRVPYNYSIRSFAAAPGGLNL